MKTNINSKITIGLLRDPMHAVRLKNNVRRHTLFMKNTLIVILSTLLLCGVSRSSAGPRTTPATESIKGQLIGLAQLVDAGNATPEAAWVSRYWARAQGDYDAVIAATAPAQGGHRKSLDG